MVKVGDDEGIRRWFNEAMKDVQQGDRVRSAGDGNQQGAVW